MDERGEEARDMAVEPAREDMSKGVLLSKSVRTAGEATEGAACCCCRRARIAVMLVNAVVSAGSAMVGRGAGDRREVRRSARAERGSMVTTERDSEGWKGGKSFRETLGSITCEINVDT